MVPEQKSLSEARLLLEPRIRSSKCVDGLQRKTATNIAGGRAKRYGASLMPIQSASPFVGAIVPDRRPAFSISSKSLRKHLLSLWNDKFRVRSLGVEDVLFLLAHPDVANTLESASFLREVGLSYDQVLELEMALTSLRQQEGLNRRHSPKLLSGSTHKTPSRCHVLAQNVWVHGQAFVAMRSNSSTLPEVFARKKLPLRAPKPTVKKTTAVRDPSMAVTRWDKLPSKQVTARSRADPPNTPMPEAGGTAQESAHCPVEIHQWVRDNCMEEVIRNASMRKNFAAEKLSIVLSRYCHRATRRRLACWRLQTTRLRCYQQIRTFCRLKCALWVLQRSRRSLECVVFRLWARWIEGETHQREDEAIAAAVSIQSWVRGTRGKRAAAVHHLHQAATSIQAGWRGFHCRKLCKRKKRFGAYNVAAYQVQQFYHSYLFRVRFAVWMRQQRAARVITHALARYIEKKRDFQAWCHTLARYHAAIAIQIWMRRALTRIRRKIAKREKLANARRILFTFLRRSKFLRCFGRRVDQALTRNTAAAVLLQNAYRAKQARARFYELKARLEDQRRQEILKLMWDNAYATTIQTWWRKRKLQQRRQQSLNLQENVVAPFDERF